MNRTTQAQRTNARQDAIWAKAAALKANAAQERADIIAALGDWIRQRAGLEYGNYGDATAYRSEQRRITKQLHDARALLAAVAIRESITVEHLRAGFRAYSGRLSWHARGAACDVCKGSGKIGEAPAKNRADTRRECYRCKGNGVNASSFLDYCTGQYWPTEYRAAACAVLASVLWGWFRSDMKPTGKTFEGSAHEYDTYTVYGRKGMRFREAIQRAARMSLGLSRSALAWLS